MPISEVFNMDCMEGMKQYPDKYFELCIADPPYGIGAANNSFISGTRKRKSTFHRENANDWDTLIPDERFFAELFRVSENQIIWGATL